MSAIDKAKNKAQELLGKGKQSTGDATNNERLRSEGQSDQTQAKGKQTGENVKDAGKNLKDGLSGR